MSESRRITLETQVDTTGARSGFNEITREAGTMANAVRETSARAQAGVSGIGDGAQSSSQKIAAAERNLVGSIQRQAAALQSGSRSSAEYFETLGKQRGVDPAVLEPYLAQLRDVEAAQARAKSSIGSTKGEMNEFGVSTAQTTAALRQLPAQVSDIVSSLAGGQSPFMVLIQQGGQIKDSFGGIDAAVGGIGGAIKGLFSTTTSGAGAVGALGGALAGLSGQQQATADGAQEVAEGAGQIADGATSAADSVNELAEASETAKRTFAGLRASGAVPVFSVGLAAAAAGGAALIAIIGAIAVAYNKGANESEAYDRALILSGNIAGATADQLSDAARDIAAITGNQGAAAAAIVELTATSQVSFDNMRRFGLLAVEVESAIGRSVSETAKDFADLGEAPLEGLKKINDRYHFITAATYAQVKALQDQGRASEAASVAQNAYADAVDKQKQKVLDTLSDWERGWIRIKKGVDKAADSVINFALGRGKTDDQKINDLLEDRAGLEENLARAKRRGLAANVATYQAELAANQEAINKVRGHEDATKKIAKATSDAAQADELRNKWLDESNILLSRQQQLTRDLAKAETEGKENGLSPEEILNRKKVIQKQYDDVAVEGIERQINARQRLAAIEDARSQRRLLQINAERAAGDLTEDAALRKVAQEELAAIDRHIKDKQDQLSKLQGKPNSAAEKDSVSGEIGVLREDRLTRQTQLEIDLGAAQRQRAVDTYALELAGVVAAESELAGLKQSTKAQVEYNEEIGLSSGEVLSLRIRREEALAVFKEETATAIAAVDPGNKLVQVYRDQAAEIRKRYMAEREGDAKQKDPLVNLRLGLKTYADEANNTAGSIGDALASSFRSAEDAFAGFVTTGKIGFSSLATSIVADLARIAAKKAIAGLANFAFDSFFGTSTSSTTSLAGARAAGGPVGGGLSYLVGEKGPEIFTPSSSGSITPNHLLGSVGGGGDIAINLQVNVADGGSSTQTTGDTNQQARALGELITTKVKDVISNERRQGGMLWNMQQGRG